MLIEWNPCYMLINIHFDIFHYCNGRLIIEGFDSSSFIDRQSLLGVKLETILSVNDLNVPIIEIHLM